MSPGLIAAAAVALGATALGWSCYFRWKDRLHPEPKWLTAAAVGGGASALFAALAGYRVADRLGGAPTWDALATGEPAQAVAAALTIGFIEEAAKALPVVLIALTRRHDFDEPLDGLVYAGCSAIGFSFAETLGFTLDGGLTLLELSARAAAAPIAHALLAAPWGAGLAVGLLRRKPAVALVGAGLSVALHGFYDLALARGGAYQVAGPGIILALWLWVIRAAPRLALPPQRERSRDETSTRDLS